MSTLDKLHEIEWKLGRTLTDSEGNDVIEYLNDDPMCTDTNYLIELFGFENDRLGLEEAS